MHNKLFIYAIAASIAVHLVLLGIFGKTSTAKPIVADQLKIVRVNLVKTPDEVTVRPPEQAPPKPRAESARPNTPNIQIPSKAVAYDNRPKPQPGKPYKPVQVQHQHKPANTHKNTDKSSGTRSAGDPGGPLAGITAPNGEDLGYVPEGKTPVGWVPGSDHGRGKGSGSGAGVGRPDPDPDAKPGPGLTPAPDPSPPPPPPQPKIVNVTVCAVSGMLPGQHCNRKDTRSYREGSEPGRRCSICKAPEPMHVNKLADRAEPELIKDSEPRIPEIDEPGDYSVIISYTVNTDGSVSGITVVESSGIRAIDNAIKAAASKMRYKPAVQNGQPRSVKVRRKYRVRI